MPLKKYVALVFGGLLLIGCGSSENGSSVCPKGSIVYEGIFFDQEEAAALFKNFRGEAPFAHVADIFHVTTRFDPNEIQRQFYGLKVQVHLTHYKIEAVAADDGSLTSNEGFKVSLKAENRELQNHLDTLNVNYHITGSFQDGAKYTEKVDFSDGTPVDFHIEGIFGKECYSP